MKLRRTLIGSIVLLVLIPGISVFAQVNRPFRNRSVWSIASKESSRAWKLRI